MFFIFAYNFLLLILYPIIFLHFLFRIYHGKILKGRVFEKFAISKYQRPFGELTWFHCASVGEFNSIKPFLELFYKIKKSNILLTSGTVTSAAEIKKFQQNYPSIIHQFIPLDGFLITKKFIKFWHPNKIIFIESEIWPNLLFHAKNFGISITLLNARISDNSFGKWRFIQKFGLKFFDLIDLCLPQSKRDYIKFHKLGIKQISYEGNLKSYFDINIKKTNIKNQRLTWLAASTHDKEEEEIITIHQKILQQYPNTLLIIAPRHPERFADIIKLLKVKNIDFNNYLEHGFNFGNKNFYLLNSLGQMDEAFSFAKFSFIGGSLFPNIGGHNPFEALRNSCLPISGKYFSNFKEVYLELIKKDLCFVSQDCEDLSQILLNIIKDKQIWEKFETKNHKFLQEKGNILEKIYYKLNEKSSNIT